MATPTSRRVYEQPDFELLCAMYLSLCEKHLEMSISKDFREELQAENHKEETSLKSRMNKDIKMAKQTNEQKNPSANLEVVKNLVLSLLAARVKREILFVINLYLEYK